MKKALKVMGLIFAGLLTIVALVFVFVLQYPNLKRNPAVGKWYRVSSKEMKTSEGGKYRAFFKKGSENKVLIYFAGGGVSVNEEMARSDTYNTAEIGIDKLANLTMNMGGLASAVEGNPFSDWTVIAFPYATGDFHAGTNDFPYKDNDGREKILYHHGYTNFRAVMDIVKTLGVAENPEAVVVTGYSAGAGGAALLANDVFTDYFPNAASKTVLVDALLLLNNDWHSIATDVWKSPTHISDRVTTNNLITDSLTALRNDFGDEAHILFDCSTRDGDLAKVQNYFDTGVMDVDEDKADIFQRILKETIPEFKERVGASLFIWDGLPWYDDPRNMTMHTIIATPYVYVPLNGQDVSIAEWLMNAVNGDLTDYGLDLVDKEY